jgi:hypothetical protein
VIIQRNLQSCHARSSLKMSPMTRSNCGRAQAAAADLEAALEQVHR